MGLGCGCAASIFNSYVLNKLKKGELKNVLYIATGALLSTTSIQQGDTVPGIAHAIVIKSDASKKADLDINAIYNSKKIVKKGV